MAEYTFFFNGEYKTVEADSEDEAIKEAGIKEDDAYVKGDGFKIGHSYFCPQSGTKVDQGWFENVIVSEVEPLLEEYWFDNDEDAKKAAEHLLEE